MNTCQDESHVRTKEDIYDTLHYAQINESDLTETSQMLCFTEDLGHNIKLLEVDQQLSKAIKDGDSLFFKGKKNEPAVLCTRSQTYEIKEVEISNSLLLASNLLFANDTKSNIEGDRVIKTCHIEGNFHGYYEVQECKPQVEQIISVLEPSRYHGEQYETSIDPETLYDWNRLQNEIQASENEIKEAINAHLIVTIGGYLRLISFEAEVKNLTLMLDVFNDYLWEIDEVDKETTYDSLTQPIPEPIFNVLFEKYTVLSEKVKKNGSVLYKYDEEKVCKMLAKVLLSSLPVNKYEDFMESWKIGVPDKMLPKEEYLRGVAFIINGPMRKEVVSFPEENLSKNLNSRFKEIFHAKEKWTIEEIAPYLKNYTTKNMNLNALLTKYTRCSTNNGIKYYSSRYGN